MFRIRIRAFSPIRIRTLNPGSGRFLADPDLDSGKKFDPDPDKRTRIRDTCEKLIRQGLLMCKTVHIYMYTTYILIYYSLWPEFWWLVFSLPGESCWIIQQASILLYICTHNTTIIINTFILKTAGITK